MISRMAVIYENKGISGCGSIACMERFQDNMKYCLADALKRCMKRAPLEKITVGERVCFLKRHLKMMPRII